MHEFTKRCNDCGLRVNREIELQNQVSDLQEQVKRLQLQLDMTENREEANESS